MPSHPERVRTAPLPAGYQFGDASRAAVRHDALEDAWYGLSALTPPLTGPGAKFSRLYTDDYTKVKIGETVRFTFPSWRPRHMNAAEQLARRQFITDRDTGDER